MRECLQWEEIWRNFALDLRITHKLELVIFFHKFGFVILVI